MTEIKRDTRQLRSTNEAGPRTGETGSAKGRSSNSSDPTQRRQKRTSFNKELDLIIVDELRRQVNVRKGNETEKMPAIRAIIRQLTEAALMGDRHAQHALLAEYRLVQVEEPWYDITLLSDEDLRIASEIARKAARNPRDWDF